MYKRTLETAIIEKINKRKAIILIGARQVGKTTLIKNILTGMDYLFLDGDDPTVRKLMGSPNTEQLRSIIGNKKIVFIDEAQRIASIGLTLKIIVDQFPGIQLLVSGSSSFGVSNALNEPLTGRKWEYELFPVSWEEYEKHHGYLYAEQQLENRLLYGFYPDVLNHSGEEKEILKNLVDSYLFRDILSLYDIRKIDVLEDLLQAIALQLGSEVNYNELARLVGVNKNTVRNYIQILEKSYVIFRLRGFSKNLRNEIKKSRKIYFYDNGVRNMIIGNFSALDLRQDKGALWENFLISERRKQNFYKNTFSKMYFWRTKQKQEIDFIEENEGNITGFEFKWKVRSNLKLPKLFVDTYKAKTKIISRDNFREFVII